MITILVSRYLVLRLTADWCCSAQAEAFPLTGVRTGEPRPAQPGTREETLETVITRLLSYQDTKTDERYYPDKSTQIALPTD